MDKILEKERNFAEHILTFPELSALLYNKERDGVLYYNVGKLYEKIKTDDRDGMREMMRISTERRARFDK